MDNGPIDSNLTYEVNTDFGMAWPSSLLSEMSPRWKAITWINVDQNLLCHMASLGHNELTYDYMELNS